MLIPYNKIAELTEEQKKRLKQVQLKADDKFVTIDGKVISINEFKSLTGGQTKQNLFG
jgi:hypothetical protein